MADEKKIDREIIHRDEIMEIVVITWLPGAETMPHDHGNSSGHVSVVSGSVAEEVFDKDTKKYLGIKIYQTGDYMVETPDTIHIMRNPGKNVARTVHTYFPPMKGNMSYPRESLGRLRQ